MSLPCAALAAISLLLGAPQQGPPAESLQAVRAALAAGDSARAMQLAEGLSESFPDSDEALTLLGHALRLQEKPAAAARAYLQVLGGRPDYVEALLGLAELQRQTGDADASVATFDRVLQLQPDSAAAHRGAGEALVQLGRHAAAAGHLVAYLEHDPASGDVRYLAGVELYLAGNLDDAITVLEEGLRRQPEAIPLQYALGVVLADRPEQHDRALQLLGAAEASNWEVADAAYLQGRILSDRGDHAGAVEAFRRSVRIAPDKLDANYRLAQSLARSGEREAAGEAMTRFNELQRAFNDAEYRQKRLGALANELADAIAGGNAQKADAAARALLAEAPDDPRTLLRCAKVWISLGDVDAAYDAVTAAAQIAPGDWEARYLEGLLLLGMERPAEALRSLQASMRARPMFADTYNVLGSALMMLQQPQAAAEAYLAAAELEPENAQYWLDLAAAYRDAGRPDLEAAARRRAERRR